MMLGLGFASPIEVEAGGEPDEDMGVQAGGTGSGEGRADVDAFKAVSEGMTVPGPVVNATGKLPVQGEPDGAGNAFPPLDLQNMALTELTDLMDPTYEGNKREYFTGR